MICDSIMKQFLHTSLVELNYCSECFHVHIPKNDIRHIETYNDERHQAILLRIIKTVIEESPDIDKILIVHPDDLNFDSFSIIEGGLGEKQISFLMEGELDRHTSVYECIILYNSINNTPLIYNLFRHIRSIIQYDGKLYVHTLVPNMLRSSHFVYRELFNTKTISLFSVNSMKKFAENNGLYIDNIHTFSEEYDIYSQHRIYTLSKRNNDTVCRNVVEAFIEEIENDIYAPLSYSIYEMKYYVYKYTLENWISQTRMMGYNIVNYYGTSFLQFFDIAEHLIDHNISDDNPLEQMMMINPNILLVIFDIFHFMQNINETFRILTEKAPNNLLNAYTVICG